MATGQTNIQWGGLFLNNVLTRQFDQEAVKDEVSGTDLLYFKYTIRVVTYLNNSTVPTFGILPVTGSGSVADQSGQIRQYLQTRQTFTMTIGGVTVLTAQPANVPGGVNINQKDVCNGPHCKVLAINHIASDTIMRAELEFEVCVVQCDSTGGSSNYSGVLNNRWSCLDDINEDFYTTRTFSGRLRCATSQVNPNSFRYLVVPPLSPGMRRKSINMRVTEDALNLEYTVVDEEIAFSAPAPATSWRLRVNARRTLDDLAWFYVDVDIMLRGDRYADKKKMIAICSAIADAKFSRGFPGGQNFMVTSWNIADEYDGQNNAVYLNATGKFSVDKLGINLKGIKTDVLGKPIDANDLAAVVNNYDSRLSRDARNGDKLEVSGPISTAGAFACYLQAPCLTQHGITNGTQPTDGTPSTVSLPNVNAVVVNNNSLSDDSSTQNYNSDNSTNAYTYWQLESQYFTTQNRAHCPVAQTGGGSSSSSQNTSVVINLSPAQTKRVIRVVAERIGIIPTLPQPVDSYTDNGITAVLLENNLVAGAPTRSPDNKQVFRISGEITYALLKAISLANPKITLGFNSWEDQTPTYKLVFPEQAEQ